ncbi:MAG TPA: hypothetical protein VEQ38_12835 [Verrucomicrobiae bacterium]|nr:hypothetical protein [Verrucomicrobiae bacterium]
MLENIRVFDCDGHIIESIPEMVPFLDPVDREIALRPSRNRQGVFAGLDAIHYPRNVHKSGEVEAPRRPRIDASDHRKGSGEDWVALGEGRSFRNGSVSVRGPIGGLFSTGRLRRAGMPSLQ